AHARQSGHDGAGGDKGSQAGDCQSANAYQPSQGTAPHRTRSSACRSALRSLATFLVTKVFRAYVLWKQHGNVRVAKSSLFQSLNAVLRARVIGVETEDCCVFS